MQDKPLGEVGDRVKAVHFFYDRSVAIDDNETVPPGTEGVIVLVDGVGSRAVRWDNGSNLTLLIDCDEWEVL